MKATVLALVTSMYTVGLILSLFIPGTLLLEVVVSFLPYWILFNLTVIGLLFLLAKRRTFLTIFSLSFLSLSTLFLLFNFVGFSYYRFPTVSGESKNPDHIKIAFLNKLFSNTKYQYIDQKIDGIKPDIIGISEMREQDISEIKALSDYPCQLSQMARDGATISLFSKYRCSRNPVPSKIPFTLSAKLDINGQSYNVIVIHPYPPQTSKWVKQRDQQFKDLTEYITNLGQEKIILLGDFNLTPWSPSYQSFSEKNSFLVDTARGAGINFTWHSSVLLTQIDHIFVPREAKVSEFKNESVEGSDHNLIWTSITL